VDGFILRANHKIRDRRSDYSSRGILCAVALAVLIAPTALSSPAFADVSPVFGNGAASASVDDHVQLAEANLPPVGSVDDYMREGNENGGGSSYQPQAVPPQGYQPQAAPPQGYYPQGVPQEWNNRYADPNAERNALIGAAVVGAVAVGLWAWQQHETLQAQRRARKRFYSHRRAYE
jgi:hypothetical protein